jgi:hypothetical protein
MSRRLPHCHHGSRSCVAVDRTNISGSEDGTLLRARPSCLVIVVPIPATLSWIPAFPSRASAAIVASGGSRATCKQLPKSEIQQLLSVQIAKVKVTSALQTGQQCVYSGSDGGYDIDVLVIGGSEAKPGFQEDVKGMSPKVAVKGVGDKAYREKGDFQIDSIKGASSAPYRSARTTASQAWPPWRPMGLMGPDRLHKTSWSPSHPAGSTLRDRAMSPMTRACPAGR